MTISRYADLSFSNSQIDILHPFLLKDLDLSSISNLIFVHPPKVAGTNLTFFMNAVSTLHPEIEVLRLAVPRIPGQSPNLITSGWEGGLKNIQDRLRADPSLFKNTSFVSGHFPVGLDEYISNSSYIALVRNPIEREISALNFDYQRGYIEADQAEEYLFRTMIDNPQTRMLAGLSYMNGPCNEETYAAAVKNIREKFLFVAPHDEANSVLQVLAGIYDVGSFGISRPQITGIKLIDTPSDALAENLARKHHFDFRLSLEVNQAWKEWKANYVAGEKIDIRDEKILCLGPEFAKTKKPVLLTYQEILANNSEASSLVEVSQNHSELKSAKFVPMPKGPQP